MKHKFYTTLGKIQVNPRGFGFVTPENNASIDVFIPKRHIKGAFDGDIVKIRYTYDSKQDKAEGRVIHVIHRAKSVYSGVVIEQCSPTQYHVVLTSSGKNQIFTISSDQPLSIGLRVLLALRSQQHHTPLMTLVECIGPVDDPRYDLPTFLKEYNLSEDFSPGAHQEARAWGNSVSPQDMKSRRDLRSLPCITIDPTTAQDFDDALSVEITPLGFLLGVHIADVAHYVKPGSYLDQEAFQRGNSVYLPGKVIPMLPHELSSHLCSLQPNVDRLALSVLMQLNNQGEVISYEIVRSVIQSKKRFTYTEAKQILDGQCSSPFAPLLQDLITIMHLLKQQRAQRGSIEFALPDIELVLDSNGLPSHLTTVAYDETHQLVEECMLKANETIAMHLFKQNKPFTYRIHDQPDSEHLATFSQLGQKFGFLLPDHPSNTELQHFFDEVRESPYGKFLATSFIKSMKIASYSTQNIGHYGLSLQYYTHCTSPIRRYIDLGVHRILFDEPLAYPLDTIATHCSEQERRASYIENQFIYLKKVRLLAHLLQHDPLHIFTGILLAKKFFGFVFELPDFLFEGVLLYEDVDTHLHFQAGEPIKLHIKTIDIVTQKITWSLA